MSRTGLVGWYQERFTELGGVARLRLPDLRTGTVLDFGTWVATWAQVDDRRERLRGRRSEGVDAME